MTKPQHQWTYQHDGGLSSDAVGPIPEPKFVALVKAGNVKPSTLVVSPTRTRNQWIKAADFPPVKQIFDQLAESKRQAKIDQKAERQRQKTEAAVAKQHEEAWANAQSQTHAILNGDGTATCRFCRKSVEPAAVKCPNCLEYLNKEMHDNDAYNRMPDKWHPGVAAVLSLLIPGAGQIYKGQVVNGICFLVFTVIAYVPFIIPGLLLHLCSVIGAAMGDRKA